MGNKRFVFAALALFVSLTGFLFTAEEGRDSFTNSVGMKMLRIEPGSFSMGSSTTRDLWMEQPVHQVTLTQPFYIAETEVTLQQYRLFQPDFDGSPGFEPYAGGVSWHDAAAFAEWLSRKEGKPYRLPTEAEWEYVARAVASPPAAGPRGDSAGSDVPGVRNLLSGVREWCADWFGEYPTGPVVDPVGPASGSLRVVRGGSLDLEERNFLRIDYAQPTRRLAMPPSFGPFDSRSEPQTSSQPARRRPGLAGVWFDNVDFTDPQETSVITRLTNNWSNDPRGGGNWSARWRGYIEGPYTGPVDFHAETVDGIVLRIGEQKVIDGWGKDGSRSGSMQMVEGEIYPLTVSFLRDQGTYFRLYWSWPGADRRLISESAIFHTDREERQARAEAAKETRPGHHAIGFRLVQAPRPGSAPLPAEIPFVQLGVRQSSPPVTRGPDPSKPYFRKRYLLPTPLENSPNEAIDAVGMHPSFRRHNHSPALEALPNGDILMAIYTSYREYEPGVSLIASRLRFGAEEWDMPSRIFDFVGVNDHAPLLWSDRPPSSAQEGPMLHLFWGNPKLETGGFPFAWTTSRDQGASWGPIRFPNFPGPIGSHSRQPINSAFRSPDGTMYLSSDGSGGESVLWASQDDGETWADTGGRSAGRHTSFALLKDGGILGLGGKNTDIDEFMPKAVSHDGGATWTVSKTPFPRQGTNQRPTLLRLASGRLLFAADFVLHNTGGQPEGVHQLGSYVALSEDEGETWKFKQLVGAQIHENRSRAERMRGPTLGYAVARQAPNGMIHLIGTMTNPCLHFEFNEAWLLAGPSPQRPDSEIMASSATDIPRVERFEEQYPDGTPRLTYSGGTADDGRFLLHGSETWYWDNGRKMRQADYQLGRRVGEETFWSADGTKVWSWDHRPDGSSVWRQWWPAGRLRSESEWRNFRADGPARLWDASGNLLGEHMFREGMLMDEEGGEQ